jgi:hypothetical protein
VLVEKQMTAHRVDRAICGWFWEYVLAHAAGDPSKVEPASAPANSFIARPTFAQYFQGSSLLLIPDASLCIAG